MAFGEKLRSLHRDRALARRASWREIEMAYVDGLTRCLAGCFSRKEGAGLGVNVGCGKAIR